jgi:hypothetical protein
VIVGSIPCSSLLEASLEFPECLATPGARAVLTSIPSFQSLDNLVTERASPLPSVSTVAISHLALTSKFIVRVPSSRGCARRAQGL